MERYGKLSKKLSDSVLIAFIHFLHNGTEIVLITIIYEMSAFSGTVGGVESVQLVLSNRPYNAIRVRNLQT